MYTPEQLAIRQHLSKPARFGGACGCMGPQPINPASVNNWWHSFTVKIIEAPERVRTMKILRENLNIEPGLAKSIIDSHEPINFEGDYKLNVLVKSLKEANAVVEVTEQPSGRYPVCPCAMHWVEEVEGNFYQISEHRSPDTGITHSATLLGPVGGPYIKTL